MNRIPPEYARPQTGPITRPVTRPSRGRAGRGPGPWLVLVVIALIPALGLFALYSWSDGKVSTADPVPSTPTTLVAPPPPPDPLVTPVLDYRRTATLLSRDANIEQFQRDVVPLLSSLNDRSCAAISVDGEAVGARNETIPVIPASNQKLLVAAAALDLLGEDHTFTTTVLGTEPVDGVVAGDVVVVGGGDPLLSSSWYPTSNLERRPVFNETSFDSLADQLVAAGVRRISGSVIGDGSRYDDEFFAPGWGSGVAGLEAGPYDALLVNDARVLGEEQRANDPNAGAAREFARLLAERGIVVDGDAVSGTSAGASGAVELATVSSAPLTLIIEEMLFNSDNNTAELLVKELGRAASAGATGTREAGLVAIETALQSWGIDTSALVLGDGSGLSLDNRLTCAAIVGVLQHSGFAGPVGQGLPVAGETGTLSDAFVGHPVAGRLRGKTGTLNNPPFNEDPPAVKSLAGYLPVDGGGAVEYALVLNGPTISDQSEYRPIWDELADALDSYPSGPSPADLGVRS